VDFSIEALMRQQFGKEILDGGSLSALGRQQLVNSLMMFVFAHRHTKDDKFLEETKAQVSKNCQLYADFDLIRNVMYKYSKRAQEELFSRPAECYFFVMFALSEDARAFVLAKDDMQSNQEKIERVFREIEDLKEEALRNIQVHSKESRPAVAQLASALL